MTPGDAFEEHFDCPMPDDYAVFFVCPNCTVGKYCADCRERAA
jgi:predicted RNA-binding Zn-ribbon protein involved in translation (DUF1610 family)